MEKVTYSIEDGIAQITMDEGKANAMNWEFFEEMGKSMNQAENDGPKRLGYLSLKYGTEHSTALRLPHLIQDHPG